jgi:SPX domain protein involved in polyphosphate accumulation
MEQRYERKYILNNNLTSIEFVNILGGNFREIHSPRIVNSIYFDNPEYRNFFENIEGLQERYKARIRWYEDDLKKSNLEIKVKDGIFGKKIISEFLNVSPNADFYSLISNSDNYPNLEKCYIPYIINLIPTSFNKYLRRYFETFDGKIRITVDTDLKFKKLYSFYLPDETELISLDYSIVEVKYKSSDEQIVSNIMKNSPLILRKFSKYTAGIMAN